MPAFRFVYPPLIISSFLLPYSIHRYWKFELALGLTLLWSSLRWGSQWPKHTGLQIHSRDLLLCILLCFFIYLLGAYCIPIQAAKSGVQFVQDFFWPWRIAPLFQAVNEEIVLRALFLGYLSKFFRNNTYVSLIAALTFTVLHWALYHFNTFYAPIDLVPLSLINLFLFGFVCNDLFFRSGHIGYGAALHVGWNLTRFGGSFLYDEQNVPEGQTFNLIESSPFLTCSLVLIYLGLQHWTKRQTHSDLNKLIQHI